ncbi:unnamed protein product [Ilex paraguariensis]|uniref:Exostosin GT47 domain-containing protein n=1 Tax=Ilex paraguariensis TaxID=185542 RepID=A0ABC8RG20_9AQUA
MRFSAFLVIFLTFWFLILFYWFPPAKPTSFQDDQEDNPSLNPAQSRCKESVYVYELPDKFNLGLLRDCQHLNVYTNMCPHVANYGLGQPLPKMGSTSWFGTHQYTAEMIFHARAENHPCRTWDPLKANLFYVPFYGGLHCSSKFREPNHAVRDALTFELSEFILQQPWWQRNNGMDHFLVLGRTAWDFMRTEGGVDFGANKLLLLPPIKNMSVLTVERNPWVGSNQHGIPYASYFHPSTVGEMLAWQKSMREIERPYLFSFIGAPRTGVEKAAIRDEIIKQCDKSTRCLLVKCGHGASKCHLPSEVLKVMASSHFCLQPAGDMFTRRSTFDSILAGCIPVFFSPHTAYSQYAWYLPADPNAYSVFIDGEGDVGKRIEDHLVKIPIDKIERMRRTIIDLIPSLTYMHPNSTGYGFQDAVDVGLASLAKHVKSKLPLAKGSY